MWHHLFRQARNDAKRISRAPLVRVRLSFFLTSSKIWARSNSHASPSSASASTRGDRLCSTSTRAEVSETKARSYSRSVTTVRWKSSKQRRSRPCSTTRSQLTFVLDSKPAPLLLQFCLRPGHVHPRAVHLLKRPSTLAVGKGQALSDIFSSMSS